MIEVSPSPHRAARASEAAPIPPAARFGSLGAMRGAHRELLKSRSAGAAELRHSIEIFLSRGQTTGQILSSAPERDDAQSMLDYWTASLCAEGHKSRDVTLEDFNSAEAQRLAQDVEQWFASLTAEEQEALRSILLRLMRSTERPQTGNQPLRLEALCRLGQSPEAAMQAVQQGESAGLIYRSPGETPENDQVEIANEAILQNWPRFEQWLQEERHRLNERRQLTAAARLWVSHGRDPGSLLGGTALQAVTQYHELSPLETDFIRASQQYTQQQLAAAQAAVIRLKSLATACSVFAALALGFAILSYWQSYELNRLSKYYLATLVTNLRMELRLSDKLFQRLPKSEREPYRSNPQQLAELNQRGFLNASRTGPGLSIGVPDHGTAGSVCCVLENGADRFILTGALLLTNLARPQNPSENLEISQPSPIDAPAVQTSPRNIATLSVSKTRTFRPFAIAKVLSDVKLTNDLPDGKGKIVEFVDISLRDSPRWNDVPDSGNAKKVFLFGSGSGYREGKLKKPSEERAYFFRVTDSDGNPLSSPGDLGAPVVVQTTQRSQGQYSLIGMLYRKGEGGKDSMVIPIQRILEELRDDHQEIQQPLGLFETIRPSESGR